MFKNLLGSWYLKKKISNGFLGEGLVSIKSKKINNFCYEEKTLIHKKGNDSAISGYQKFDIVENKNFIKFYFLLGDKKNKIYQKFNRIITNQDFENLKICFNVRAYETQFQKSLGKKFLNHLNIDTCTYCNRNYTLDFKNLNNSRAQLDHWFPKESFPILALSFYNLIPSCSS